MLRLDFIINIISSVSFMITAIITCFTELTAHERVLDFQKVKCDTIASSIITSIFYFPFHLPPSPPLHVQCWLGHFFNLPHGWPANIQKTSRLSLGETSNTSKMLCIIFQNEKLREGGKQGTVNCIIFFWIYSRLLAQNILKTLTLGSSWNGSERIESISSEIKAEKEQ